MPSTPLATSHHAALVACSSTLRGSWSVTVYFGARPTLAMARSSAAHSSSALGSFRKISVATTARE
jgi:hypothetical protein